MKKSILSSLFVQLLGAVAGFILGSASFLYQHGTQAPFNAFFEFALQISVLGQVVAGLFDLYRRAGCGFGCLGMVLFSGAFSKLSESTTPTKVCILYAVIAIVLLPAFGLLVPSNPKAASDNDADSL